MGSMFKTLAIKRGSIKMRSIFMNRNIISVGLVLSFVIFMLGNDFQNKQRSIEEKPSPGTQASDSPYDIILIEIPAGKLTTEADYERPAMVVNFKGFFMAKYEVTQKQWKKVMGTNPSKTKGDNLPVTNITWHQALEFVKILTRKTGHIYRLPTSMEWEYACRAGTTTDYYFGVDISLLKEHEWYKNNAGEKPHPVGIKKPNPWGLYDMAGNVNEWTATYWDPEPFYRKYPKDGRVFKGIYRIVRGSSFRHGRDAHFRSNYEHAYPQVEPRDYLGFRVLREK
jgi:formylglycine-generating enzyme required for sulfatase activity